YQFIRLRDKDIQIYFRNNKIVEGKLIEADREKIIIKDSNKKKNENTEYNYNEIKYAKLKLKW
ncbi:MAG: hypothetical protein U9N76_04305, partial [Candidatus Marinimicrobia bacterium]|nr:hypothetical protein [Candidatus Neomarinimicrobiota bacterium]